MDAIQIGQNSWTVMTSDMRMRLVSMICNIISENHGRESICVIVYQQQCSDNTDKVKMVITVCPLST